MATTKTKLETQIVTMVPRKETKGAVAYETAEENGDNPITTGAYLRKSKLDGARPTKLRVTIEDISDE
jgi:hypothetical protein